MQNLSHILETIMLLCFGLSWPMNLMKNYKARTAKSTSLFFILLILAGYVCGIAAKLIKLDQTPWYVLAVYILNFVVVSANLVVYFRNVRLDKQAGIK